MTRKDDGPILRVELRPHAQADLVGLPAKQLGTYRPHEGAHAIETFGLGAGRQPFEVAVGTRDVAVRAGSNVNDDVSALRHEYGSPLANCKEQFDGLIRLLQTELLSRCQQCERFANTPFPGVRPLGRVNPNDEVTAVGWRQLPKELPSFGIGLYRFRDVIRQVGDYRARPVGVLSRCG